MLISIVALKSAVLCVADKKNVRKYLQSVFVNGEDVVGTNGHIAFIETTDINNQVEKFDALLPPSVINGFLDKVKNISKDASYIEVHKIDSNKLKLVFNDIEEVISYESKYVGYKTAFRINEVIQHEETKVIQLNLDYINVLNKINKLVVPKRSYEQPILNFRGENGMVTATWANNDDYKFFVMPMRNGY